MTASAAPSAGVILEGSRPAAMLLDELEPVFDTVRTEHRIISGDPRTVYEAVRQADFVAASQESRAVRFLFAVRTLGERTISALRRRPLPEQAAIESMRVADLPSRGEWVTLGENAPHEIAFGAIGHFWAGETAWQELDASEFADFCRPGFARIACSFSLRPYGADRTLVSYECRTQATDDASRRAFLRYWRPLSPFIGVVMRAQLRVIDHAARR